MLSPPPIVHARHTLRYWFSTAFVAVVGFFTACLFSSCQKPRPVELRIGINTWPGYEFLHLAQVKGYYDPQKINVTLVELGSLSDIRRSYERGQINVFCSTLFEVLQARALSQRTPQVFAITDYSEGADVILARPSIPDVASLKGRTIGLERGTINAYLLGRALETHGLSIARDVTLVGSDQESLTAAYAKGEIDAVVTYPPFSIKLLADSAHPIRVLYDSRQLPGEIVDTLSADAELIRHHPHALAELLRAFFRAQAYTRENPTDAYAIMAAREGITPEEFKTAIESGIHITLQSDQAPFFSPGGHLTHAIQATDRLLRATAQLEGPDLTAGCHTAAIIELLEK